MSDIPQETSPRPWEWWTSCSYRRVMGPKGWVLTGTVQSDGTGDLVFREPGDAELMIRAVNCHDELVAAVEWAEDALSEDERGQEPSQLLLALRKILAKARNPYGNAVRHERGA